MEQSKGHGGANVVTVIMKSKGVDLQSAADFVAGFCESLTLQLLDAQRDLKTRSDPAFYVDGLRALQAFGDWVRGNDAYVMFKLSYSEFVLNHHAEQLELRHRALFRETKHGGEGNPYRGSKTPLQGFPRFEGVIVLLENSLGVL